MPWIFNEDRALKTALTGLKVTDTNAPATGRPVPVRFRLPETELTNLTYPTLIIDHASVEIDHEREHRGYVQIPYAPEGMPWWEDAGFAFDRLDPNLSPYKAEFPIPYNIDYQITLLSRKAQHHMALIGMLAAPDRIPARFGALDVPEDKTVRRLDLLGGPEMSTSKDGDGKNVFAAHYRVRVSSELLQTQVNTFHRVLELVGTILDVTSNDEVQSWWVTYNGEPPTSEESP